MSVKCRLNMEQSHIYQSITKFYTKFFTKFPLYLWGFLGSLIILGGCILAAIGFETEGGQKYSILYFFISELGGIGLSNWAFFFNWGLILGSIPFSIFMIGLAIQIKSRWGFLFAPLGLFASINCLLVGIFPWNVHLEEHGTTAMNFFYSGMIIVFLYSIFFFLTKSKVFPRALGFLGIIVAGIFAAFLFLPLDSPSFEYNEIRNVMNWMAFLEWLVLFAILTWILTIAIIDWRAQKMKNTPTPV